MKKLQKLTVNVPTVNLTETIEVLVEAGVSKFDIKQTESTPLGRNGNCGTRRRFLISCMAPQHMRWLQTK